MCRLCLVDGLLNEKLDFVGSCDLKMCALLSVYVYSSVVPNIIGGLIGNLDKYF